MFPFKPHLQAAQSNQSYYETMEKPNGSKMEEIGRNQE